MSETLFVRRGNSYFVTDRASLNVTEKLEVGTYSVRCNEMTKEYYLEQVDNFILPEKLYGNTVRDAARIMNTYVDRNRATGVLLVGEKGSGKSLLAKKVSLDAASKGIPTIIVDSPHSGESFYQFIQKIEQQCVVLFDEFEKVYSIDSQQEILTLFDGVYPTNKLWLLTANNEHNISDFMVNRPSRMYYYFTFNGLTPEFVREYCEDRLANKSLIDQTVRVTSVFANFNFDMLQTIVEEMNRYGESPTDVIRLLNTRADRGNRKEYRVTAETTSGELVYIDGNTEGSVYTNPLIERDRISIARSLDDDEADDEDIRLDPSLLVAADAAKGKFVFHVQDLVITYTVSPPKTFNWANAF